MQEGNVDMMEKMHQMGEKFTEFKKTWVAHFKDFDFEIMEWNFGVQKTGNDYVVDMKAKVSVKPKKK